MSPSSLSDFICPIAKLERGGHLFLPPGTQSESQAGHGVWLPPLGLLTAQTFTILKPHSKELLWFKSMCFWESALIISLFILIASLLHHPDTMPFVLQHSARPFRDLRGLSNHDPQPQGRGDTPAVQGAASTASQMARATPGDDVPLWPCLGSAAVDLRPGRTVPGNSWAIIALTFIARCQGPGMEAQKLH